MNVWIYRLGWLALFLTMSAPAMAQDLVVTIVDDSAMTTDAQRLVLEGDLTITFSNIGNANVTQDYRVTAFLDVNQNGQYDAMTDRTLGNIDVSGTTQPNRPFSSTLVGIRNRRDFVNQPIYAMVDQLGTVAETNENNNVTSSAGFNCNAQNRQDLSTSRILYDLSNYPMRIELGVRVGNGGLANAPAGATVRFYDANPTQGGVLIGSGVTSSALASNFFEDVAISWMSPPANITPDSLTLYAVVDETNVRTECKEDNNSHEHQFPIGANVTNPPDNSVISTQMPTISGTGRAGSRVNFVIRDANGNDRVTVTNVTLDMAGNWSFDIPFVLNDGTYTLEVTPFDEVGNQGLPLTTTFTVDTVAAIMILDPGNGQTIGDNTPTISGGADPNAQVTVNIRDPQGNILQTLTTTTNAQGVWQVDAAALAEGNYVLTATAIDVAGNVAMDGPKTFTLDDTPPMVAISSPADGAAFATNMFQVTGTADAGSSLTLEFRDEQGNLVRTRSLTVPNNGMWSTGSGVFADGRYTITATAADPAGNSITTPPRTVRVDTLAPITVITSPIQNGRTNDTTPAITGTTEPGATLTVIITDANGNVVQTIMPTVGQNGAWSFDAMMLPAGDYTIIADAVDAAGNVSRQGPQSFAIDTMVTVLSILNPTDGSTTSNKRPQINGDTEPAATVKVVVSDSMGNIIQEITTQADAATGTWQMSLVADLVDGDYTVEATATDIAGNVASVTNSFTVNTSALALTIDSPTASSSINDTTPTIVGTTAPNTDVDVTITDGTGALILSTTVQSDANGDWSLDVMALTDGPYVVDATVTNQAGTVSSASTNFTVDTTVPGLTITSPVDNSQINNNTPDVVGISEPGAQIEIVVKDNMNNVVQTVTTTTNAQGAWQDTLMMLADGTYTIEVTSTDGAGNMVSDSVLFDVDTMAPTLTITSPTPNNVEVMRTVTVSGTSEPNQTVVVEIVDAQNMIVQTLNVTTDAQGMWQTQTQMLPNGDYTARATATDGAANERTESVNFSVDSDLPNLTVTAPQQGESTQQVKPAITGMADADATVRVIIRDAQGNTIETIDAPVDANGNFSVTPTADLAEGGYNITITATRNGKMASKDVSIRVDLTAPTTTITTPADGALVADETPDITGTSEPGASVTVVVKDMMGAVVHQETVTVDAAGMWRSTSATLAKGAYSVEATATDAAGNSAMATPTTFTIDFDMPVVTITSPANGDTVEDTTPVIKGTSTPSSIVEVFVDGVKRGETNTDAQGNWSFTIDRALAEGDHTIEATTTDAEGRQGSSGIITVTIKAPTIVTDVTITSPTKGQTVTGPTVTVQGKGEPGSTVTVTVNGMDMDVVVADDGTWTTTVDVPEGQATITATSGDSEASVVITVKNDVDPTSQSFRVSGGACSSTPTHGPSMPAMLLMLFVGLLGIGRRRLNR